MKIAYDAKRAFNNFTGLGNYSRFIIDGIHRMNEDLLLYTPKITDHTEAENFSRKYKSKIIQPKGMYGKKLFQSIWRSSKIYHDALDKGADIFHGLSNELPSGYSKNTKRIVTIHDLIFIRYPEFYPFIDRKIYMRKFKKAAESADLVIAVSEQTKSDLIEFLKIDESKIKVNYQGVHSNYHIDISANRILHLTEKYKLHDPYFIYVGSIEERKNALQMVKAFSAYKKENADETELLIIGKKTDYQAEVEKEIEKQGMLSYIKIMNKVPFSDLPFLYKGAVATIYPSSFEGFGIPVLESLTMRTPVIAGKGSAMEEAGGNHAHYIDPQNLEEFTAAIKQMVESETFSEQLLKNLDEHLKQFESEKLSADLLKLYQSVL